MKICPKCQKTYNDEALNFCLDDGAVLNSVGDAPTTEDSPPPTVMMNPPRKTSPSQSLGGQSQPGWSGNQQTQQQIQPTWGNQQSQPAWGTGPTQTGTAGRTKSRSWIWVLGILAAVVVVCGGGLVGLVVFFSNIDPSGNNGGNKTNFPINNKTPQPQADEKFDKIDLSTWTKTNPAYANSEYKNGEYIMGTKQRGYYYVLVTTTLYQTEDAITRLTVRNPEGKTSRLGYGLIFHSNPKPLTQDYGFLIDAEKQRYRVVKHTPGKETDVVKWTKSNAIKGGEEKNILEVRDKDGKFDLFINGELVKSLTNSDGYKGGVPGVYSGDGVQVAFSNLEISR
ncbi:MAG: hypothetical protein R2747_04905 [Pyrinomonadaceae bacterium]